MKKNYIKTYRNVIIVIILALNIGCDQISKNIVRENISYNERISVIDNFITLTKVENTGAFLSLGNNLPKFVYILIMIIFPLIVIAYVLYYLFKNRNLPNLLSLGICLAIAGGIGNIIDRILYQSVTDFLHFDFVIFQTGIVNFADISITIAFFVLIYELFLNKEKISS